LRRTRTAIDIALVSSCAVITAANGLCQEVKIGLGAVAPTPIRASKAEAALDGQLLTEALADKVGSIAAQEARPISDVRSSAEYRRAMVGAMTKRAILNAAAGPAKFWVERRDRRY
jgi:carbon-monoxide dehydrogenase medium subunit